MSLILKQLFDWFNIIYDLKFSSYASKNAQMTYRKGTVIHVWSHNSPIVHVFCTQASSNKVNISNSRAVTGNVGCPYVTCGFQVMTVKYLQKGQIGKRLLCMFGSITLPMESSIQL